MDACGQVGERGLTQGKLRSLDGELPADMLGKFSSASVQAFALFLPNAVNGFHHLDEARPAVSRHRRKIGPAPKGSAGGRQKHGQWPAALLAHGRQSCHVDLVDVGPLLAIHLDIDEEPVHDVGNFGFLEAFMRHDVAPVAGRVADGQEYRPVERLGLGERGL
jgi:hypothetical protein